MENMSPQLLKCSRKGKYSNMSIAFYVLTSELGMTLGYLSYKINILPDSMLKIFLA